MESPNPFPLDAAEAADTRAAVADAFAGYEPVKLERVRTNGWTAPRQRIFLMTLAETGSISTACWNAGVTPSSAYRLRNHPNGESFARGWEYALDLAVNRIATLVFERATRGTKREVWRNGELVAQSVVPSDRMAMFLLTHLDSGRFGMVQRHERGQRQRRAASEFCPLLETLEDQDLPADPMRNAHFIATPPASEGYVAEQRRGDDDDTTAVARPAKPKPAPKPEYQGIVDYEAELQDILNDPAAQARARAQEESVARGRRERKRTF